MKKKFAEIAHHYLRSGLKGQFEVSEIQIGAPHEKREKSLTGGCYPFFITYCTPIMYDMADIDKEITVNGETFVPRDRLNKLYRGGGYINIDFEIEVDEEAYVIPNNVWDLRDILIEWHFNCFSISDFINKREHEQH